MGVAKRRLLKRRKRGRIVGLPKRRTRLAIEKHFVGGRNVLHGLRYVDLMLVQLKHVEGNAQRKPGLVAPVVRIDLRRGALLAANH